MTAAIIPTGQAHTLIHTHRVGHQRGGGRSIGPLFRNAVSVTWPAPVSDNSPDFPAAKENCWSVSRQRFETFFPINLDYEDFFSLPLVFYWPFPRVYRAVTLIFLALNCNPKPAVPSCKNQKNSIFQ